MDGAWQSQDRARNPVWSYCVPMSTRLGGVVFDAREPGLLARFWADGLGWMVAAEEPSGVVVEPQPHSSPGLPMTFVPVTEVKRYKNRLHLDLVSSTPGHQAHTVAKLARLGARPVDVGQRDAPWIVLADPEGNEFCVLEPREVYQDTGVVAAIVVEAVDPAVLATFWSEAIGWPITDRGDRFASLRSATGQGPYLEFLPSVEPKRVKNRTHLHLVPEPADDRRSEVERLLELGASEVDIGQGDVSWSVLADPAGNEFCVLEPRTA